jgi:hypothetical protein
MPLDQEDLEMFATELAGIRRALGLIAASNLDEVIVEQRAAIRIFRDD